LSDSIKAKIAEAVHELKSKIPFLQGGDNCSVSRVDDARVTATKLKALEQPVKTKDEFHQQMKANGDQVFSEERLTAEQAKKTRKELTHHRLKALDPDAK
tara:strand:+ start:331 stop:630 length:300 start_codon:yes stop_codon:yes gene_type:complete